MKINLIDDDNIIIYLSNNYTGKINFKDKDELQDYFRCLFLNLKKNYNISLEGYYDINVYVDKYYGSIIELHKEDFEYYDSIFNQVDMRISVIDASFLYEISDPFFINKTNLENIKLYFLNNKFYVKIINELNYNIFYKLLEQSKIIYDNVDDIIYKSTLVTIWFFMCYSI